MVKICCIHQLCCDEEVLVIAIQEHWLTNDKLCLLNTVHPDFNAFAVSVMTKQLA